MPRPPFLLLTLGAPRRHSIESGCVSDSRHDGPGGDVQGHESVVDAQWPASSGPVVREVHKLRGVSRPRSLAELDSAEGYGAPNGCDCACRYIDSNRIDIRAWEWAKKYDTRQPTMRNITCAPPGIPRARSKPRRESHCVAGRS